MTTKINPERIVSYNEALMITNKEYNLFKQLGQIERNKIESKYNFNIETNDLIKNIIYTLINEPQYKNLSTIKKEIILANSMLPEENYIINVLNEYGFTKNHLKAIIRFRSILKNYLMNKKDINNELKEKIDIYIKIVNKLIYIFNTHFDINNPTIILNKISEMLITSENLFKIQEQKNKSLKYQR